MPVSSCFPLLPPPQFPAEQPGRSGDAPLPHSRCPSAQWGDGGRCCWPEGLVGSVRNLEARKCVGKHDVKVATPPPGLVFRSTILFLVNFQFRCQNFAQRRWRTVFFIMSVTCVTISCQSGKINFCFVNCYYRCSKCNT